jgi:hypothetical protein
MPKQTKIITVQVTGSPAILPPGGSPHCSLALELHNWPWPEAGQSPHNPSAPIHHQGAGFAHHAQSAVQYRWTG